MLAAGPGDDGSARWRGLWSGIGAVAAFCLGTLIANAVHSGIAFGLVALAATAAYFGVGSLGPALSHLRPQLPAAARPPASPEREESTCPSRLSSSGRFRGR